MRTLAVTNQFSQVQVVATCTSKFWPVTPSLSDHKKALLIGNVLRIGFRPRTDIKGIMSFICLTQTLDPPPTDGRKSLRLVANLIIFGSSGARKPTMNLGHAMARRRTRNDQVVNSPADVRVQTPQRAGESLSESIARAFGPAERVFAVYSCWPSCCGVAGCSVCVHSRCV